MHLYDIGRPGDPDRAEKIKEHKLVGELNPLSPAISTNNMVWTLSMKGDKLVTSIPPKPRLYL